MKPAVVISLDFELRWGVLDSVRGDPSAYRSNLAGVRRVVPALLELFGARGVRATWAVVGSVACRDWDEWRSRAPAPPQYRDASLLWQEEYARIDPTGSLYFAPDLVDAVAQAPGQDLGSHTFSHVYFCEPGFTREDAEADSAAVARLFRDRWNRQPVSFVFPRNQVGFTDVLRAHGIRNWRENPASAYWTERPKNQRSTAVRALRFADAFLPIARRRQPSTSRRASYFVRFGLPEPAFRAHVRRIAGDAARMKGGEVLHLWWHPHNLGAAPERAIGRVARLLDALEAKLGSGMRFSSMADLAPASVPETATSAAAQALG